jgi:transcriptional regulator GlxA family with amidase domain
MIVGIPVYEGVDVLDVTGPLEMFSWAGLDVEIVAREAGLVTCRNGTLTIQVTKCFSDASDYDVLWVPGGYPDALVCLMTDPERTYLDFLVEKSKTPRYVASVCEGALLLAAAGVLDGYEATTHWAFIGCLTDNFPKVKVVPGHPRFAIDRNRITGGGISSGLDEALELIQILLGTATAQSVQLNTQYYPYPPVTSAIPDTPPPCPFTW